MKCSYPISMKHGSRIITFPCGQCMPCRVNKTSDWALRIVHESMSHVYNSFVTLTYNDQSLPENGVNKKDIQDFMRSLRKKFPEKIRFFASAEYGDRYDRPHYHVILFGLGKKHIQEITASWNKGFVHIGNLSEKSAAYTAKYIQKKLTGDLGEKFYSDKGINPEFMLCSRMPGIGNSMALKYIDFWINKGYIMYNGVKRSIPKYYQSQLKEKLQDHKIKYKGKLRGQELKDPEKFNTEVVAEITGREQRQQNILARHKLKKSIL